MRLKYAFIAKHQSIYTIARMCRVLRLHPSGYCAWKVQSQSQRVIDDQRLLALLKQAWLESGGVCGYRKLPLDMCDMGEQCSRYRVARLLCSEGIKAQRGYGKRPCLKGGAPALSPSHWLVNR